MATKKPTTRQPRVKPYIDPWRAEDDARTLAKAEEIRGDKSRHKQAINHVTKLAKAVSGTKAK